MTNVIQFVPLPPPRCSNCRWWTPFDACGPHGFCEAGDETVHEGWSCENWTPEQHKNIDGSR